MQTKCTTPPAYYNNIIIIVCNANRSIGPWHVEGELLLIVGIIRKYCIKIIKWSNMRYWKITYVTVLLYGTATLYHAVHILYKCYNYCSCKSSCVPTRVWNTIYARVDIFSAQSSCLLFSQIRIYHHWRLWGVGRR